MRVDKLIFYHRGDSKFQDAISSLIYTLIIILFYALIFQQLFKLSFPSIKIISAPDFRLSVFEPWGLLFIVLLSVFIGLSFGYIKNKDFPLYILRKWNMTKRTYHSSYWYEIMNSRNDWIIVKLRNGDELIGYPERFNNDYEKGPALLINHANWQIIEGVEVNDNFDRTILLNFEDINLIEFINEDYKNGK